MKITIYNDEKEEVTKLFSLVLPTSLLRTNFVFTKIFKEEENETDRSQRNNIYKVLKKYIRENGHFTLLEIYEGNKLSLKITI